MDEGLFHFSALVMQNKRPQDLFARMGGEEFMLILPDTDLRGSELAAQRLHALLNRPASDTVPPYTCSFGVGTWSGHPVTAAQSQFPLDTIEAWFKRVDDGVYRAKSAGRNRIELVP